MLSMEAPSTSHTHRPQIHQGSKRLLDFHSSSFPPNLVSQLHPQLCSRPSVMISPPSLPPFTRDLADPGGTPCLGPHYRSLSHPVSPSPTLSVSFWYLETHLTRMPSGHTWQVLRRISYQAAHSHHCPPRTREGHRNQGMKYPPNKDNPEIIT